MERLTKRDIDGCLIHPWSFNGINGSYDIWDEDLLEKQIDSLAAYEDTGLEPEEIKVHEAAKYNAGYYHGDEDRCRWIEKELGPIDHLRDLIQAEQDGRLVVLPCKVGDTVYVIGESCDFCETYLDEPERCMRCEKGHYVEERGFELWMLSELNESIFLTSEEAEAALAGKGGAK